MSKTAREVIGYHLSGGEEWFTSRRSAFEYEADSILQALRREGYVVVLDDYEELERLAEKKLLSAADGE